MAREESTDISERPPNVEFEPQCGAIFLSGPTSGSESLAWAILLNEGRLATGGIPVVIWSSTIRKPGAGGRVEGVVGSALRLSKLLSHISPALRVSKLWRY